MVGMAANVHRGGAPGGGAPTKFVAGLAQAPRGGRSLAPPPPRPPSAAPTLQPPSCAPVRPLNMHRSALSPAIPTHFPLHFRVPSAPMTDQLYVVINPVITRNSQGWPKIRKLRWPIAAV
jgi:hypothetical protein